ncbi:MAG: hypothetical protein F6J93_01850 [Oscillatoria sp. SIO1A7]|nr:hypothetical protein [Oscillatoria sp. SIO1A7]
MILFLAGYPIAWEWARPRPLRAIEERSRFAVGRASRLSEVQEQAARPSYELGNFPFNAFLKLM